MKKAKLKDMSYADRERYRYHKRLLGDLRLYGARFLKEQAERILKEMEDKYAKELEE